MHRKIIAIDIDGVLNDYPNTWIDFANEQLNTSFVELNDLKNGISYREYKDLKELYRTSGIKETFRPKQHAVDLLNYLKFNEYFVVVMTSRPIDEYNELLFQTINWLNSNSLMYDFLYFSKRKHLDIIEKFKTLDFMIEDNRSFANDVAKQGYRVFLLNNSYNYGDTVQGVIRINSLDEISDYIEREENL